MRSTVKKVMLDEVAGLTELQGQDPGTDQPRKCKDYSDFRQHCIDHNLKQMYFGDGSIQITNFCVEYDIHPSCANTCSATECQAAMAKGPIEVGVPFWRGRCNATANQIRHEIFANAFGIQGA